MYTCVHLRTHYLYLSRILCRRVIVSSRNVELFFMFNDQPDEGDETDGFEGKGIRGEGIGEGG